MVNIRGKPTTGIRAQAKTRMVNIRITLHRWSWPVRVVFRKEVFLCGIFCGKIIRKNYQLRGKPATGIRAQAKIRMVKN
jgi:hypothetical protein